MSHQSESIDPVLYQVEGFAAALEKKKELENTGSDFTSERGAVRKTVSLLHPKRLKLKVTEIRKETPSTNTLVFKKTDLENLPPFQAGQYINLFVRIDNVITARPYSISSSPLIRDRYELTIKRADGGFVSPYLLDRVKVGDTFESSGPMGSFHYNPLFHGKDLVFLAGGSGIAPAMSMLKTFLGQKKDVKFQIIYSNSFETDIIFKDELRNLKNGNPMFSLLELVSREVSPSFQGHKGRLNFDLLKSQLSEPVEKMYYICGPTPFNEHCIELLTQLGVPSGRILIDGNGPPKSPESLPGWPSEVSVGGKVQIKIGKNSSFLATIGEPLLNSLERNGYTTENACRSGECSLCRLRLLSGQVFQPSEAKIRKSDKAFGYIHSCVSFPLSDIEIQL